MPKKVEEYENERQEIIKRILKILGIDEKNNLFCLREFDEDKEKQKEIEEIVPEIKRCFICGKWNYFLNKKRESDRKVLSLIRSIFKEMGVQMEPVRKKMNGKTQETFYIVIV